MEAYGFIIATSVIIIISYLFNMFAKRTNVPSVLLLIGLGILIKQGLDYFNYEEVNVFPILEVLGIVGLIMIILEASIDLELRRDKLPIILKSFAIAILSLIINTAIATIAIYHILDDVNVFKAILYAIPLSIMSSAIIIPSVGNLPVAKKEFMIYESAFSDILGIMAFYFLLGSVDLETGAQISISVVKDIFFTIAIAFIISYLLIILFQKLKTEVKLFLLIAVLLLLYAIGKMYLHMSSLLIILVFGLVLKNHKLFFKGFLKRYIKEDEIKNIFKNFKIITLESSFLVRTFFFVVFGLSITFSSFFDYRILLITGIILGGLFIFRFLLLKLFIRKKINPELFLSPRGLITILLFYAIPDEFKIIDFDMGIILYTIIATSIIMAISLIRFGKGEKKVIDKEITSPDTQNTKSYDDKYSDPI